MQHTSESAIRRTPSEIWAKIFQEVLRSQRPYAPAHTSFFPLLPRQVCREWRQVADSTPSLWTHLYIFSHNRHNNTPLSIHAWIQRAGSLDFHFGVVDFGVDGEGPTNTPTLFDELASILWPYLERLGSLAVPDFFAARLPRGRLTGLHTLILDVSAFARLVLPTTNPVLDELHISSLSTTGRRLPIGMTPLRPPWAQLSRLALHRFIGDIEVLGGILEGCSRLVAFELDGHSTRLYLTQEHREYRVIHGPHGPPRFLLTSLRSLRLRTDVDGDMELFLESFGMPDLRMLRVDLTGYQDYWYQWQNGLCECVSRSPNIQTLSLSGISSSRHEQLTKMVENSAGWPLEVRIVARGSSMGIAEIALDTSLGV